MNQKTLLRGTALLILLGLVFGQFIFFSPAQAATGLGISFGPGPFETYPNEPVSVSFTEVFPDLSGYSSKSHMQVDTQFILTPPGNTNLGGMTISATQNGVTIGQVTLVSGQTTFWASAFGGALSRRPAQRVSSSDGTSYSYVLVLTPPATMTGTLGLQGTVVVAKNNDFNSSNKWATDPSALKSNASTSVQVYQKPVLDPGTISGPYTVNTPEQVQIKVSNIGGKSFSALKILYDFGTLTPITNFQYQMPGGSMTPVSNGVIGPLGGFPVADEVMVINLSLTFTQAGSYPITLRLVDTTQGASANPLSISNTDAIVMDASTPAQPDVFSNDLEKTNIAYNPYKAGVTNGFTVVADNFSTSCNSDKNSLQIAFSSNTGSKPVQILQYLDPTGAWIELTPVSSNGGALWTYSVNNILPSSCPWAKPVTFQIVFANAGTYSATLSLLDNKGSGSTLASQIYNNVVVSGVDPTLSTDVDTISFTVGTTSDPFTLTVTNPNYGTDYSVFTLELKYTLAPADGSILYKYTAGTAAPLQTSTIQTILGSNFLPTSPSQVFTLAANFANAPANGYTLTFSLVNASDPSHPVLATTSTVIYPDLPTFPLYLPLIKQ